MNTLFIALIVALIVAIVSIAIDIKKLDKYGK